MILRPMEMSDADKMLEWKNYPETRHFAIESHDVIRESDHLKYLENNLQYFQIIGDYFGAVRIKDKEISIWIDRNHRGKGIALLVINQVAQKNMTCKIVDGNIASFRSFIDAGFKPISHIENYYILQK